MKLIVGIDFGTSTTVVRYKKEGSDDISDVKDMNGTSDFIPSAIFRMDGQGTTLYGHAALTAKQGGMAGSLITNFKMGLLDATEDVKKEKMSYIEEFLAFVYQRFEQEVQGIDYDSLDVYISYPAKWSDGFVNFMKSAVIKAGFSGNVYGVNEPKAATYNMIHRNLRDFKCSKMLQPGKPMHVFMLDMGAGTTDIVIFRLSISANGTVDIDNLLSYPTVDNPYLCGGREIDHILSEYVTNFTKKKTGIEELDDFFTLDAAKFWKDQTVSLGLKTGSSPVVPTVIKTALMYMPNGKSVIQDFLMTKQLFEQITNEHWKNLYELICSSIDVYESKYNIGTEDIDLLFLTGGHSQWYTVKNLFNGVGVNGYIGKDFKKGNQLIKAKDFAKLKNESWRLFDDSLPHECVAKGLCLQDSTINLTSIASNNIWIQLEINESKSDPILVVEYSQELPTSTTQKIDLGKIESDWDADKGNDFRGYFYVYTGNSLETAICQKKYIELDVGFGTFLLFGHTYLVSSESTIQMNEEGMIDISGYVRIEKDNIFASADYIHFKNSDFKEDYE